VTRTLDCSFDEPGANAVAAILSTHVEKAEFDQATARTESTIPQDGGTGESARHLHCEVAPTDVEFVTQGGLVCGDLDLVPGWDTPVDAVPQETLTDRSVGCGYMFGAINLCQTG
jgi:hypothetical protein